ncbi:HAMP domain-containing histidine kinase [Thermoleptolyngbya oregonensis NK1-22]|uniref:histidine kinase n=1 Tax=Thermoleptolyngbya oregonensis NK1-22 TaxID=2547457 RepID=A0AA97BPE0_9CYAN|nr:HAMP domain-containing histidine kinase [Thermoleptolyngbya oregonensis NK1-22]
MTNLLHTLFGSQGYIPHGHCYLWQPWLVWLHVASNAAIALAYFSIPALLLYFIAKRRDVPFNWMFVLFGAFIIACGIGHLMDIWTIWHPSYWLSGVVKAFTAIISIYTAIELVPLIPQALALPSPAKLEAANRELERALRELQSTQSRLIQAEKLSNLGQLVSGIAHEINNPVNFIYGNINHVSSYTQELLNLLALYRETVPQPAPAVAEVLAESDLEFIEGDLPKTLSSMQIGADRIRQIVLSLRNFSRVDEAEMKPVNLHDGIDSTLMILQHRLKPKGDRPCIQVVREYGDLPKVECYAGQLNQVFMNILSNAIDALEEACETDKANQSSTLERTLQDKAPVIKICTRLIEPDNAAKQVEICIADNGPGIPKAVQAQIYEAFYTTKPLGKGTGLGLAISHQIVTEKHRGQLICQSDTGQGTTFLIQIPLRQSFAVPESTPTAARNP